MRSFVEWLEQDGFWVREIWDEKKGIMVGEGQLKLFPEQHRILEHALSFNEDGLLPYTTVLYSTIKKSGKTTLAAAVAAWVASEWPDGSEIYIVANDQEQAEGRVMKDVKFHVSKANASLPKVKQAKITGFRIEYPNGTFMQALAQSYRTAAGGRQALVVFDELWGVQSEQSRRTFEELTPIATVPNSLRFIATYAGFENESDLLWDLYLHGVGTDEHTRGEGQPLSELHPLPCWRNSRLFVYWNHEPNLPWHTDDYFNEQIRTLRPAAFLRLHRNQWVTTHEEFLPVEWWDAASKAYQGSAEIWSDHPFAHWPLYIAVDASTKHDCTAVVGVGYDSARGKVGVAFHRVWKPVTGEWFDLDKTVGNFVTEISRKFTIASVVYDPTQLHQTMTTLRNRGLPVREFPQSVPSMTAASQLLYDLFRNHNVETYPDDEFRRHVQMSVAETSSRGFRIVKHAVGRVRPPNDLAIALAMAAYDAVSGGGVDISVPVRIVAPFADMLPPTYSDAEAYIPYPLRS